MAYNRSHARALLTDDELALFSASLADAIGSLSGAELKRHLDRTRRARDKYRDLFQRQRLTTRERSGTKGGRSGVANERTEQKAKLLDEALGRFQKRTDLLAEREAAAAQKEAASARRESAKRAAEVRKAQKAKPAAGRRKPAAKATSAPTSADAPTAPAPKRSSKARQAPVTGAAAPLPEKKRQMGKARSATVKGSVSQSVRKAQAKRDSR